MNSVEEKEWRRKLNQVEGVEEKGWRTKLNKEGKRRREKTEEKIEQGEQCGGERKEEK